MKPTAVTRKRTHRHADGARGARRRVLQAGRADRGAAGPGNEAGPRLRRAWDVRAWADDRSDKVVPRSGEELRRRWLYGHLDQICNLEHPGFYAHLDLCDALIASC